MPNLKKGDVLVWRELKGRVEFVYDSASADVVFDGSSGYNFIEPGTLALATVEEPTLTGAEVLRMLADGRKPEEFEYRFKNCDWGRVTGDLVVGFFNEPSYQFRVKP